MTDLSLAQTDAFCRDAAISIEEPLGGTAAYGRYALVISWPKTHWHSKPLLSRGIPAALSEWMADQKAQGASILLRLAHQPGLSAETSQIFIYPDNAHYGDVPPQEWVSVIEAHFAQTPIARYQRPKPRRQLLICTHGKRDKCCAKYGQALVSAFKKEITKRKAPIDLWESSHQGGHRFAATGTVFPSGHCYGWISPPMIPQLLDAIMDDAVYAPAYRGRFDLPPLEQTIEAYAHCELTASKGNERIEIEEIRELSETERWASVALMSHDSEHGEKRRYTLTLALCPYSSPDSCGKAPEVRLRWIVHSASKAAL